jgi:hypothetical protein
MYDLSFDSNEVICLSLMIGYRIEERHEMYLMIKRQKMYRLTMMTLTEQIV